MAIYYLVSRIIYIYINKTYIHITHVLLFIKKYLHTHQIIYIKTLHIIQNSPEHTTRSFLSGSFGSGSCTCEERSYPAIH